MKRALISVLRLAMFIGALVALASISKGPEAQNPFGPCDTFETAEPDCSCCTSPGGARGVNIIVGGDSVGVQSPQAVSYSCGTALKGCAVACSDPSVLVAVPNPACPTPTGGGGGGDPLPDCPAGGPAADQDQGCNPSPVIIDVDGSGFQLTNAAGGVRFDISGTGTPIQMGWTAQGAANAFLALPGADGLIDSGKQLFGNFTSQPPSNNPNGFAALAVYDLPANGGNGDGIIDFRDAVYSALRLWIDANHDGISQPQELHTLSSLGVVSISLKYTLSRRVDQYGNVFRYKAAVDPNDPEPSHVGRTAYDVFFVTAASSGAQ
ncbi:MAG TPA: hypothetical protein VN884_10645 [Candidatus Sulfotelmatobacter sp.]|nr:hypothetical protein [Candidatus Sulfotelmatobacter sp.]